MSIFLALPLIFILFLAFVLTVFYLMTRWKRTVSYICAAFVGIGFFIYTAGYLSAGAGFAEALFAALRGIFSTARMFVVSEDYWILMNEQGTGWLTENAWMRSLLWASHLSALMLIQTALISLFGRRLIDQFRLRFGLHREVYIIKGGDKNALILGENIATRDDPTRRPDANRLVLFLLDEADDSKKIHEQTAHFSGVVQVLDRNHHLLYHLEKAQFGKRSGRRKKYHLILLSACVSASEDAQRVAAFGEKKGVPSDKLSIFLFAPSEWEREKIEEIKNDKQQKYPYTFHILCETDLLVRQMIAKHPPFECPGLAFSNGVAARGFTVMIAGFGEVGQAAFLRLVMNGQFFGGRMRAIIVDKNMDHLKDDFLRRYPSLALSCETDFHACDVQNAAFLELLEKNDPIDYIVVALDSDKRGKRVTQDIKQHYRRKEGAVLPFIAVSEEMGPLHEVKPNERVFTFGCREEIYRDSVIIQGKADRMAQAVHEVYGNTPPWHELAWFYQESSRAAADFIPAILYLAGLKEKDAIGLPTLTEDPTLRETLAQTEKLRWNAFHAAMGYSPISIAEMERRFEAYGDKGDAQERLDSSRRDENARLHVCLVPWEDLDPVSDAYRALARRAEARAKEQARDFKDNDRNIVLNIPKFLSKAT